MKVAIVGPVYPYRGGIAHFTTQLVEYLKREAHDVIVYSFKRQYPVWLYPGKTDKDTSQKVKAVEAEFLLDPLNPFSWFLTGRRTASESPDVVVIMWWTTFWALPMAVYSGMLRKKGIKVVYIIHNVMPHEAKPWDPFLSKLALRNGRAFLTMTEKETGRLRRILPNPQIAVTPHPVYNIFESGGITKTEAREILNLPPDEKVILFFGIIRPYKGLRHLLHALALLREKRDFHLVVAGEFWEPETEYVSLIHEMGIEDLVHLYGRYIPNEEVPAFFSAADIFVAPYTDGTQSGAVKIALGFDLPLVITQCILDDSLSCSQSVIVSPDHKPENLAAAIETGLNMESKPTPVTKENDWVNLVRIIESL